MFLTARELTRHCVSVLRHAYLFKEFKSSLFGFGTLLSEYFDLTDCAVLKHRHIIKEVELLKDHPYLCPVVAELYVFFEYAVPFKDYISRGWSFKKVYTTKHR